MPEKTYPVSILIVAASLVGCAPDAPSPYTKTSVTMPGDTGEPALRDAFADNGDFVVDIQHGAQSLSLQIQAGQLSDGAWSLGGLENIQPIDRSSPSLDELSSLGQVPDWTSTTSSFAITAPEEATDLVATLHRSSDSYVAQVGPTSNWELARSAGWCGIQIAATCIVAFRVFRLVRSAVDAARYAVRVVLYKGQLEAMGAGVAAAETIIDGRGAEVLDTMETGARLAYGVGVGTLDVTQNVVLPAAVWVAQEAVDVLVPALKPCGATVMRAGAYVRANLVADTDGAAFDMW